MRRDMKHVVSDVYRGSKYGVRRKERVKGYRKYNKLEDMENFPKLERMVFSGSYHRNGSVRTNPLYNFIRSKVGENWDDVFSDICRNDSEYKIRKELKWMINIKVTIIDGVVYDDTMRELGDGDVYVDPTTKLITKYIKETVKEEVYKEIVVRRDFHNENIEYRKLKGIWYKVEFVALPELKELKLSNGVVMKMNTKVYDVVLGNVFTHECKNVYRRDVYAHKKTQLNGDAIEGLSKISFVV
jgi:hypothetical protein